MTLQELAYAMAFERLCTVFGLTHCAITFNDVEEN